MGRRDYYEDRGYRRSPPRVHDYPPPPRRYDDPYDTRGPPPPRHAYDPYANGRDYGRPRSPPPPPRAGYADYDRRPYW